MVEGVTWRRVLHGGGCCMAEVVAWQRLLHSSSVRCILPGCSKAPLSTFKQTFEKQKRLIGKWLCALERQGKKRDSKDMDRATSLGIWLNLSPANMQDLQSN